MKLTLEEMYTGVTKKIKYKRKTPCSFCSASEGCSRCDGRGLVLEESKEEISIPEGVDIDMTLNFKRKGHYFSEEKKFWEIFSKKNSSYSKGNLIVKIEPITHDVFRRFQLDLIYPFRIAKTELTKGDKTIEIQHLNKEMIKVMIPKVASDGNILRIAGKGFKNIADRKVGDLLIVVKFIED